MPAVAQVRVTSAFMQSLSRAQASTIASLVAMIADVTVPVPAREAACGTLQNLASEDNAENQAAIREAGGLRALAVLIGNGEQTVAMAAAQKAAVEALHNLRTDATNAAALETLAQTYPGYDSSLLYYFVE